MILQRYKLLVIDDDLKLGMLLCRFLRENGYDVHHCDDGKAALERVSRDRFSLIILDIMMPNLTGFQVLERLQQMPKAPPVLMLTALGNVEERIKGLAAGANDYLPKPFDTRELLLRIKKQIAHQRNNDFLSVDSFTYDIKKKQLFEDQKRIVLTTTEEVLLSLLAQFPGKPISRETLAKNIGCALSPRTIDVQINRLRRKIKNPLLIKTVRHKGYALMLIPQT